ncbi:hypothetical protein [Thermus islandicus]|uniref:hypothetical protein n=1 Tax=Thermus islandicus TaxID=540988 RepID=UPI0003B4AB1E|nr:hypothetical protein [Thermus islandicus]
MKRWLYPLLALVVLVLLALAGYQAYASYRALNSRVAVLEAQVKAHEATLKSLAQRLSKVEEEVFKAKAPPLSFPEVPRAEGGSTWPYVVGAVAVALLLYLLLALMRRKTPEQGPRNEGPPEPGAARTEGEGAPPQG